MERWLRLASLGDVERGFAVVGEESWVFCSRGAYLAFAVARASARPGIILERLDQIVLAAEEARLRKDGLAPTGWNDPTAATRRRRPVPPTGAHGGPSLQLPDRTDRPSAPPAGTVDLAGRRAASVPGNPSPIEAPATDEGRSGDPPGPVMPPGDLAGQPAEPVHADAERQRPGPLEEEDERAGEQLGQRSLWVMDVDDLTREFAGLLEEPDDRER